MACSYPAYYSKVSDQILFKDNQVHKDSIEVRAANNESFVRAMGIFINDSTMQIKFPDWHENFFNRLYITLSTNNESMEILCFKVKKHNKIIKASFIVK